MAPGQCCYGAVIDLGGSLVISATLAAVKVVIAPTTISSDLVAIFFLGWLTSRNRLVWKAKPAPRTAEQRNDQGSTTNNIVLLQKSRESMFALSLDGQRKLGAAVPVANLPFQLTRACQFLDVDYLAGATRPNRGSEVAAWPRQCYYRPSRNGPCT